MRETPDWLLQRPIAHRGLHDRNAGIPENSPSAFAAAADAGYAIELDVRLAGDGTVVVFHDADLARMTGAEGKVADRSYGALAELSLLGSGESMPKFEDLLTLVKARVPLLVELKKLGEADSPLEPAVWNLLATYAGPYTVQSFEPMSVAWFARHAPGAIRGQIARKFSGDTGEASRQRGAMLQRLMYDYASRPDYIAYSVRHLPYPPVARARSRGLPIIGYTLTSQKQALALAPHLDNMIFENFIPAQGPKSA
jgi:glycerophosphoryl diester phosphodiesterase